MGRWIYLKYENDNGYEDQPHYPFGNWMLGPRYKGEGNRNAKKS